MYQNLQTYDYLMDQDNCLTFKSFSVRKAKSGSFRSFCQQAVVIMDIATLAYVDGDGDGDDSGNSNNNDEDDKKVTVSSVQRKYNKRAAFFQDTAKIKMRLNKRLDHQKQLITGNRIRCMYCCCKKHNEHTGKHSRQGHKTYFECSTCMVPLCYGAPRYGDYSCAKLFHEVEAANDHCVSGSEVTVRKHKNRAPPPSRKQYAVLDRPNSRSKSSAISSPRRVRPKKDLENRCLTFT
jgi:hypothetical protein